MVQGVSNTCYSHLSQVTKYLYEHRWEILSSSKTWTAIVLAYLASKYFRSSSSSPLSRWSICKNVIPSRIVIAIIAVVGFLLLFRNHQKCRADTIYLPPLPLLTLEQRKSLELFPHGPKIEEVD
jgi:hypothetical protein